MFLKILVKEWKENVLVFALALMLMTALVVLNLSDQRELILYFSGMFLFLFLPFASALIGSGAFYSEIKDNAWVYLFSRPIRREKIFVYKYLSQLSLLAVIVVIFMLIRSFLPGLGQVMRDIDRDGGGSLGILAVSLYILLPLAAFSIAFSLSILYEKQFVILFITILIGVGFVHLVQFYIQFVLSTYGYWENLKALPFLITLSFVAASFLTFLKTDFSQMKPKILRFLRYLCLFLLLTFVVQTVWIGKANLFSGNKEFSTWLALKHEGDFYAAAYGRGMLKYDYATDEAALLRETGAYFSFDFAFGGDKIAVFKDVKSRSRRWDQELWIMNTDGSGARALFDAGNEDSPFYGLEFSDRCHLSADGKSVIFATIKRTRQPLMTTVTLWWMDLDARGMRSQNIELLGNCRNLQPFAWQPEKNWLCLGFEERSVSNRRIHNKIIKIFLDNGDYEVLSDIVGGFFSVTVSPQQEFMVIKVRDPQDGLGKLMMIDLRSGESNVLSQAKSLLIHRMKWDGQGQKLAFSRPKKLYVYDVCTKEITDAYTNPTTRGLSFDWAADSLVILRQDLEMNTSVKVLGPDFKGRKEIPLPGSFRTPFHIWGLKDRALISAQNGGPMWRVDLDSEEWKKVY